MIRFGKLVVSSEFINSYSVIHKKYLRIKYFKAPYSQTRKEKNEKNYAKFLEALVYR